MLHTPQGHTHHSGSAVVVGDHHDLPPGLGAIPRHPFQCGSSYRRPPTALPAERRAEWHAQVVYATAVAKPGHGNIAPLAIGFTLFASAFVGEARPSRTRTDRYLAHALQLRCPILLTCAGGPSTGAALNPARVLGPAMVFHCYWSTAFVYVFAEFFGAVIAAALALPLYGFGPYGAVRVTRWLGLPAPHQFSQVRGSCCCGSIQHMQSIRKLKGLSRLLCGPSCSCHSNSRTWTSAALGRRCQLHFWRADPRARALCWWPSRQRHLLLRRCA